eukprot:scaffold12143_cov18-Tisochrysis_lutea.AAC.3
MKRLAASVRSSQANFLNREIVYEWVCAKMQDPDPTGVSDPVVYFSMAAHLGRHDMTGTVLIMGVHKHDIRARSCPWTKGHKIHLGSVPSSMSRTSMTHMNFLPHPQTHSAAGSSDSTGISKHALAFSP